MKPISFSKLELHKQCPRKYKYKHIDKVKPEQEDFAALVKGRAIHAILEDYPVHTTHKGAERFQNIANRFIVSDLGQGYLETKHISELKIGLDKDLNPTDYNSKDAIFRGIVDYVSSGSVLNVIDFKTGKLKELQYQSFDQLTFYAIFFFRRYPNIEKIRISYVYVEHLEENDIILERKYLKNYENDLLGAIARLMDDVEFPKKPQRLCEWCEFKEHCANSV